MQFGKKINWGATKPSVGYGVDFSDPISKGLVGCWLFNEGAGNKVYDIAGKNTGTLTNGPTWRGGKFGKVINFDGVDDYVLMDIGGSVPTSITLSAWIYPTAGGVVFTELGQGVINSGWHESQMEVLSTGEIKVGYWAGSLYSLSLGTFNLNSWHHVVLTFDDSNNLASGYVNGVLRNSGTSNKQYPPNLWYSVGALSATSHGDGTYFNGSIDNARLYNRALSAGEVQRLYSEPFAGILSPVRRVIFVSDGGGSLIKTINGLAQASVKTVNGLASASVKTVNGLSNV